MKLTTLPVALRAALATASKATSGATYGPPILRNVLLRAVSDWLMVSATNIEHRVDLRVSARIEDEGAIAVAPTVLDSFLSICPDGEPLALEVVGTRIKVACGRATATLVGMAADDFPEEQQVLGPWLRLPAPMLKRGLDAVLHAAAANDTRPVLAGVDFKAEDGRLTLSAADGFCISTWGTDGVEGDPLTKIIPARALRLMLPSLAHDEPVTLELTRSGGGVRVAVEGATWTLQTIDGDMPNFRHYLDKQPRAVVTYDRDDLDRALKLCASIDRSSTGKDAVRRALLLIDAESTRVLAEDTLDEHAASIEIASSVETGEPRATSFNAVLLRNGLAALTGARVALEIPDAEGDGLKVVVAREVGERNSHLQAVVQLVGDRRTEDAAHHQPAGAVRGGGEGAV